MLSNVIELLSYNLLSYSVFLQLFLLFFPRILLSLSHLYEKNCCHQTQDELIFFMKKKVSLSKFDMVLLLILVEYCFLRSIFNIFKNADAGSFCSYFIHVCSNRFRIRDVTQVDWFSSDSTAISISFTSLNSFLQGSSPCWPFQTTKWSFLLDRCVFWMLIVKYWSMFHL